MFGLTRPLTQIFALLPKAPLTSVATKAAPFHSLTCAGNSNQSLTQRVGGLFDISVRNMIRVHFPRPNEVKRVRRHGWKKRMSDAAGRRVLMHRILKGRHFYSH